MDVLKRNGKKQRFTKAKLIRGLERALKEAKVPLAKRKVLVKDIIAGVVASFGRKKLIKAVDLRARILRRLDSRSKATAKAWKRYDKKRH